MSWMRSRELVIGLYAIVTLAVIVGYFLNVPGLTSASDSLIGWGSLIALFTLVLGLIITLRYHAKQVIEKTADWPFSSVTIVCIFAMLISGFVSDDAFNFLYVNVLSPLNTGILSFVGFIIYAAIYRTFKARSWEVLALIISTVALVLNFAPVFESIHPALPLFGQWINDVPSSAAQSGILVGVAIGLIAVTIRTILGHEKIIGE